MRRDRRSIRPRFKLWLSSDDAEGVFGDGKWRLLQQIEREGSLREAANALGMSYRKAWGDLKKSEECLGMKFIEKRRGGAGGGETLLTETGRMWLGAYGRLRTKVEKVVLAEFEKELGCLSGKR